MPNPKVELHIAGHGVITLELDEDKAPKTVANFLAYVKKGHYDGTIFHRVIDGFMVQGGGFAPGMQQKPTDAPIENEANNGLKNDKYTVAMARTSDPHSATRAVLHQRRRQRLPQPHGAQRPGLGLCGVRQGRRRHRRRRPHQGRQDRPQGHPRRRADAGRRDREGGRRLSGSPVSAPPIAELARRAVLAHGRLHLRPAPAGLRARHVRGLAPATWRPALPTRSFILGDLFEAWPGDDVARTPGLRSRAAPQVLRATAHACRSSSCTATATSWWATAFARATGVHAAGTIPPCWPSPAGAGCSRTAMRCASTTPSTCDSARRCAIARLAARVPGPAARDAPAGRAVAAQRRARSASRPARPMPTSTATRRSPGWPPRAPTRWCTATRTGRATTRSTRSHRRIVLTDWDLAAQPAARRGAAPGRGRVAARLPLA